jgi:CHAD domain-containing protein
MATDIKSVTKELKSRRKALLSRYDVEDLHQLRVNIRKLRALLKHYPDPGAVKFRKKWGRLAQATNAARDWDTLVIYTELTLSPADWKTLEPLLRRYRDSAREQVLDSLQSGDWDLALESWKHFLKRADHDALEEDAANGGAPKAALRALRASRRALSWEDEGSWHSFRIAIKNLRYTLNHSTPLSDAPRQQFRDTSKFCKRLQNELGDWHDTVVHRNLLARLAEDPAVANDIALSTVLDTLGAAIRRRSTDRLLRVKAILDHQGWLLSTAAGELELEDSDRAG